MEIKVNYLTIIIANTVNIDVHAVVFTGEIAYHANELYDKITGKVNNRFIGRGRIEIKIWLRRCHSTGYAFECESCDGILCQNRGFRYRGGAVC